MLLLVIPRTAGKISQLAIADRLLERGIEIGLWLSFPIDSLDDQRRAELNEKPCKIYSVDDFIGSVSETESEHDAQFKSGIIESLPRGNARTFTANFDIFRKKMGACRSAIQSIAPKGIIVSSDGIAGDFMLTSASKEAGIPILCCPYGYSGMEDLETDLANKIKTGRSFHIDAPGGDIIRTQYSHWIKKGQNEGHLMFRPEIILAWEGVGASVARPWNVYGSEADIFLAPSEQYAEHVVHEGFAADRVRVAGSVNGDVIWHGLKMDDNVRAAFRIPRKINENSTKVLLAMPPSYHPTRGEFTEFPASYLELVKGLVQFRGSGVELTVSVHPSTAPDDKAVFSQLNIPVIWGNVIPNIPRHDILISDFSSVIRWATACGKPVVNYDFYNFNLAAYEDLPGVLTMRKHQEYEDLIKRLVQDDQFYRETASAQIEFAERWGVIDGRFIDRLMQYVDDME